MKVPNIILGFALGAVVVLLVVLVYLRRNQGLIKEQQIVRIDTLRTNDTVNGFTKDDFLLHVGITEEKLASVNKRFDDLYILGSIIVMLLVVIVASVYLKTESDVKKHLEENFGKYKDQVLGYVTEAEQSTEKVKTEIDLIAKLRKSMERDIKDRIPGPDKTSPEEGKRD